MVTNTILGILVLGGVGGLFLGQSFGRWRAEYKRAKFDQDRIWNARKLYRRRGGTRPPPPPTL